MKEVALFLREMRENLMVFDGKNWIKQEEMYKRRNKEMSKNNIYNWKQINKKQFVYCSIILKGKYERFQQLQ